MSEQYFTTARPVKAACYIVNLGGDKVRVRATHSGILALLRGIILPYPRRMPPSLPQNGLQMGTTAMREVRA